MSNKYITVISGLPRSGTSMMSMMLEAGGIEIMTDHIRKADDDNPKGYYEFERVKKMPKGDVAWLKETQGKAVKIISSLLQYLPDQHDYKIIFMNRNMEEILKSQNKMLMNLNQTPDQDNEQIAAILKKHLTHIKKWLDEQSNISVLEVDYNQLVLKPEDYLDPINDFFDLTLDTKKMQNMIDVKLYRNRAS